MPSLVEIAKKDDEQRSKKRRAGHGALLLGTSAGAGAGAGAGMVHLQRKKTIGLYREAAKQSRRQALKNSVYRGIVASVAGAAAETALKAGKVKL